MTVKTSVGSTPTSSETLSLIMHSTLNTNRSEQRKPRKLTVAVKNCRIHAKFHANKVLRSFFRSRIYCAAVSAMRQKFLDKRRSKLDLLTRPDRLRKLSGRERLQFGDCCHRIAKIQSRFRLNSLVTRLLSQVRWKLSTSMT